MRMTSNYEMNQNTNDLNMLDKKGSTQKGMHHNHQTNHENRNELTMYSSDFDGSVWTLRVVFWTSRVVFGGRLSRC